MNIAPRRIVRVEMLYSSLLELFLLVMSYKGVGRIKGIGKGNVHWLQAPLLSRNMLHSSNFPERTIGNSGYFLILPLHWGRFASAPLISNPPMLMGRIDIYAEHDSFSVPSETMPTFIPTNANINGHLLDIAGHCWMWGGQTNPTLVPNIYLLITATSKTTLTQDQLLYSQVPNTRRLPVLSFLKNFPICTLIWGPAY